MTSSLESKLTESAQYIVVSGSVVFNAVSNLVEQWKQLTVDVKSDRNQDFPIIIDCGSMQRIDSAGIALFLDWKRFCNNKDITVIFENLPEQACSLIGAYRLQTLFKL